jgi:hypothetical protein
VEGLLRCVKPSEVDVEVLMHLRSIEAQVKRLLAPRNDPEVDERMAKDRAEELEAVKSLAAKIKDYLAA